MLAFTTFYTSNFLTINQLLHQENEHVQQSLARIYERALDLYVTTQLQRFAAYKNTSCKLTFLTSDFILFLVEFLQQHTFTVTEEKRVACTTIHQLVTQITLLYTDFVELLKPGQDPRATVEEGFFVANLLLLKKYAPMDVLEQLT